MTLCIQKFIFFPNIKKINLQNSVVSSRVENRILTVINNIWSMVCDQGIRTEYLLPALTLIQAIISLYFPRCCIRWTLNYSETSWWPTVVTLIQRSENCFISLEDVVCNLTSIHSAHISRRYFNENVNYYFKAIDVSYICVYFEWMQCFI